MKQDIIILGSTGSIGLSTLKSIYRQKNFNIKLLTTNKNLNKLFKQAILYNVKNVIVEDKLEYLRYKD